MKALGWILVAAGAVVALLALDLVNGNPELATPGQPLVLGALQGSWRFLFGILALLAAFLITAGIISLRRLPGLSFLALIAFVVLSVPYIVIGGLAPSYLFALLSFVVMVVIVPALVWLIASAIGKAVRNRRTSPTPAF